MIAIRFRLVLVVALVLAVGGCDADQPWAEVGGQRYQLEIAADHDTRVRGLMFRDELAADAGMLFIWPSPAPRAFWMRNTRIPLDILYIGSDWTLVGWSLDTPPCRTQNCPSYPSGRPAQYVLEVNAGEMQRLGVKLGDRVRIGNVPGLPDS